MASRRSKLFPIDMNKHKSLSVVLATHNEQDNLGACLESVKSICEEIVIVDGKSTDNTKMIAEQYGAKIISVKNEPNFHKMKNIAIDAAKCDWILQLDADERLSSELAAEIKDTINSPQALAGYWMNRKNWFLGKFLTKGGQYPDPTLRLYKNGLGRLPAVDVHEQAMVVGGTGRLKNDLLHYRDTSFEKYLNGFNRYSSFISSQLSQKDIPVSLLSALKYLFIKPLITFFKIYIRHKGFMDGYPGLIFALFSGLIHPVSYMKYSLDSGKI